MRNRWALKTSTVILVLISSAGVGRAGQKKGSAPAPAPSRPAAPVRTAGQPGTRPAPGMRPATGQPAHAPGMVGVRANAHPGNAFSNHYAGRPGDQAKVLPGGRTEFHNANGQTVITNAHGEVQRIEAPRGLAGANKMVIDHGPRGGRMVENGRPGARVVSYGPHRGFVERPLRPGYMSRTYVRGGRTYAHVFREYRYHNMAYYRYVHGYYYDRRFYGWAVNRWGAPGHYAWSGIATPAPWMGYYRGYFTPYPVYDSPDMWLTDYLITENLRLAYENEQAEREGQPPPPAPNPDPNAPTLSPKVKEAIAAEVKEQLAAEQAAAAKPPVAGNQGAPSGEEVPDALSPTIRVFVVASSLDLSTPDGGQPCSLSPGDVLMRLSDSPDANQKVNASVQSSKQGGCATGQTVSVSVQDLQEMHNHFQEQLDSGLGKLAENQAKGLPTAPQAGGHPVPEGTAEPAPEAESQLAAQDSDATKVEAQVRQN